MHIQQYGIAATQMDIIQGIRLQPLDGLLEDIQRVAEFCLTSTQAEGLHQENRRACDAQEDPYRRESQRAGFCKLDYFFEYLAAAVDDFLDVFVVDGVNVQSADFFQVRFSVCENALYHGLHSD